MKSSLRLLLCVVSSVAVTVAAGCGGGSSSGDGSQLLSAKSSTPAPSPAQVPAPAPTTVDGAAVYAAHCAGCHGALQSSSKQGVTAVRLQNAIGSNIGGMGSLSTLSAADTQAVIAALNPATTPSAPAPAPAPVASTVDGAALYAVNCAGCHGSLASSGKKGITVDRLQGAIANGTGGMGALAPLTASDVQAIVTALTPATPTPTPTPVPTPVLDGPTLYNANCAACHGPLTSSAKAGASSSRIQTAISNGIGGMGYLSSLSSTQLSALASALATVTPSPTPTTACGSCHAIPPAAGKHSKHAREGIACASCHGTGYSTTSFNAATHNNGVKNIATNTGWNSATRTCANACHGKESW